MCVQSFSRVKVSAQKYQSLKKFTILQAIYYTLNNVTKAL